MDDEQAAMRAVVEDMGNHARVAKARKWAPKPKPKLGAEEDTKAAPELAGSESPSLADLEALLDGQHSQPDVEE